MMEGCKWRFAKVDGVPKDIVDAVSGERGKCPLCGADMVAKVGEVRVSHWSHFGKRICDDWYQPKGPWHLYWQNKFPKDWQEVVINKDGVKHIADVKTSADVVVEAQWSPISHEEINDREVFYNKMLWIVGMNRIESDWRIESIIKRDSTLFEINGFRIRDINTLNLTDSQCKWFDCSRPVFMDFGTSHNRLDATDDLYYIFPKKHASSNRFCIEVPRDELIDALRNGNAATREFFQKLKDVRVECERIKRDARDREYMRIEDAQRRAQEDLQHQQEEVRNQEYDKARPYLNDANSVDNAVAFANKKFHYPPRCALTLGWVDAYLIIEEFRRRLLIKDPQIAIAPYGRVAVHLAEWYSRDEYEHDCAQARRHGVNVEIESYETLAKYRDKMIACVDYLVKRTDRGVVLTFRDAEWILRSTGKAYSWGRSERTFWALPERTQEYLGSVDPESHAHIWL